MQEFEVIDSVLFDCQNKANPLKYLTPVNGGAVWRAYKEEKKVLPFQYEALQYDPAEVKRVLEGLEVPEGHLADVYKRKIKELLQYNAMIASRGDAKKVRELTRSVWGTPDKELVGVAETILNEPAREVPKGETPQQVYDVLTKELEKLGLQGWKVVYSKKYPTTVTTTERTISVCEDKQFNIGDSERLRVHEINVHVLRAANGGEQPYGIFELGLPGWMSTEEGLAAYAEELTETGTTIGLRKYAGRVMATHFMDQGLSLVDTFKELKGYKAFEGAKESHVWAIVARVYRGGGFFKDHLYLKGYLDVKRFAEDGGNLSLLYVGKVGLHDLPLVNELLVEEKVHKPRRVPEFISVVMP